MRTATSRPGSSASPPCRALEQSQPGGRLYVLIGAQGAGKSTWAAALKAREPRSVLFDAILVKKAERAPIIAEARRAGVETVAVWFQTSLESCLGLVVSDIGPRLG